MSLTLFEVFLLVFASFRLTRLFVYDLIMQKFRNLFLQEVEEVLPDGSTQLYIKVREGKIRSFFGNLLSCFWCTGIWSTIILYAGFIFFPHIFIYIIAILAIAGIAAIVEVIVQKLLGWL